MNDLDSKTAVSQQSTLNVQRYILALIYLSNGGDDWINNDKWMTKAHECEWYGVQCNVYEGMVDMLDLSSNNLKGFLPSELGELRGLEYLVRFTFNRKLFVPHSLSHIKH